MKNTSLISQFSVFLFLLLLVSCSKESSEPIDVPDVDPVDTMDVIDPIIEIPFEHDINSILNPSGYSPLVADISITTNREVKVKTRLIGLNGPESDLFEEYEDIDSSFNFISAGLYIDHNNLLEITFIGDDDNIVLSDTIELLTEPGIEKLPVIDIESADYSNLSNEMYLINYFGYIDNRYPNTPVIFDNYGNVRWYLDYSNHPVLFDMFYDVGLSRLQNGNWVFADVRSDAIYEIDMTGDILNTWELGGYVFHHQLIEKPDGNFLFTATIPNRPTRNDAIVEIDRNGSGVVKVWDMIDIIDVDRDIFVGGGDWFHGNGLTYSPKDNCIIVSGRHQGVFKIDYSDEIKWLLAPHKDWEKEINGVPLSDYLLQPLDNFNQPILDELVLGGEVNHSDFIWNWFQHSPILKPNGNLMIFDNGVRRNYMFDNLYSRVVEYEINDELNTVKQVWEFGESRGNSLYCQFASSVRHYEDSNSVVMGAGGLVFDDSDYGKVLEIDPTNSEVLFEAKVKGPNAFGIILFHNAIKVDINDF